MRLALAALVAVALAAGLPAAPALAQEAPPSETVVLHGWGLPEGASVQTTHRTLRHATHDTFAADTLAGQLKVYTMRTDSLLTVVEAVSAEGPTRILEAVYISDILEDVHEGEEVLTRGRHPEPLSGTQYLFEREGSGWARSFLLPEDPSEAQRAALAGAHPGVPLASVYPGQPVAVGEQWTVDRDVLAELYGPLAEGAEQRLTVVVDSVGTFLGRPAAFLSHGLSVTLDQGGGRTLKRNEVGMTVRLLDVLVDVLAQRQGTFRSEAPARLDDGTEGRAVLYGSIAASTERWLTLPAQASALDR
jgi:hypothetical protein